MEYQASPADEGDVVRAEHTPLRASAARFVDSVIASLLRLRNRIEAPAEEEESGSRRRKVAEHAPTEAAPPAAQSGSRLRRFLVLLLVLASGAVLGMTFSYRLLSHALSGKEAALNALRDDIAELEKENSRNLGDKAKYQKQLNENDKEMRALQREIEDYRSETEMLRSQISAARGARPPLAGNDAAQAARRPLPQKTGTCTTGTGNTAADLTRCVEEFNRR